MGRFPLLSNETGETQGFRLLLTHSMVPVGWMALFSSTIVTKLGWMDKASSTLRLTEVFLNPAEDVTSDIGRCNGVGVFLNRNVHAVANLS